MVFGRRKQQPGEEIGAPAEERIRLTPVDVQQKVFRLAFRGYNEQDVDRFLDHVTEDLAALHEENKRLHEELELRGPGGGGEEARRHAEEIIRQAREEAARIAAGGGAALGAAAPAAYLMRERQFLQQLAGLVQEHAGSLKQEARRAREGSSAPEEQTEPEEPDAAAEAQEPVEEAQEPVAREEPEPEAETSELEETAAMAPPGEPGDLSEWTNPFITEEGGEPAEPREVEDQEPSLRELFWGEE